MAVMAPSRWPCIFLDPRIKTEVNPTLAKLREKVPFGAFQESWRRLHCRVVNPHGSEWCPYRVEQCIRAYYNVAELALAPEIRSPIGFFRTVATRRALARVEHKPEPVSRIIRRTSGQTKQAQGGLGDAPGDGVREGRRDVRRAVPGPRGIGSLLGGADVGPREGRPAPEREGT